MSDPDRFAALKTEIEALVKEPIDDDTTSKVIYLGVEVNVYSKLTAEQCFELNAMLRQLYKDCKAKGL